MTKIISLILLILSWVVEAIPSTYEFWVQIKASQDTSVIRQLRDSLSLIGLNTTISTTLKDQVKFYRLRVGPTSDSICILNIKNFFSLSDAWVVREKCGSSSNEVISSSYIDTISSVNKAISLYQSNVFPADIIQIYNYGIERAVLPPDLCIYFYNGKRLKIDNATGFFESANSLKVGKVIKIYSDPGEKGIDNFSKELTQIAKSKTIPIDSIGKKIMFLNDGIDACLTMLTNVSENGMVSETNQIGFDFVDKDGKHLKHSGVIKEENIGNFASMQIDFSGNTHYKAKKSSVYIRPLSSDLVTILFLFSK
jgi:hypothetical protein